MLPVWQCSPVYPGRCLAWHTPCSGHTCVNRWLTHTHTRIKNTSSADLVIIIKFNPQCVCYLGMSSPVYPDGHLPHLRVSPSAHDSDRSKVTVVAVWCRFHGDYSVTFIVPPTNHPRTLKSRWGVCERADSRAPQSPLSWLVEWTWGGAWPGVTPLSGG